MDEIEKKEEVAVAPRRYQEALKTKFGDEYNAENELDMMDRYAEESEGDIGRFKDAEGKMAELIKSEPELGAMMYEVSQGSSPRVAFIKAFGVDGLEPLDGDEDYEANMTARGERSAKADSKSALDAEIEKNEADSLAAIDSFCEANGLEADGFMEKINEVFISVLHKKITPEMLEGFNKMFNYDADVADAKEAGAVEGRNTTIDATKAKDKKKKEGDNLPGGTSSGVTETGKGDKVSNALRQMGSSRTNYAQMGKK